jgi:class 3 adenylate cyclase
MNCPGCGHGNRDAASLDRFFQIPADGVHRFEGTVNQYTGDS